MDKSIFVTGPEPTLKLIYSDVWLPGLYSRRVMCFKTEANPDDIVHNMQRALKALVQALPELGATSVVVPHANPYNEEQPWRALEGNQGIELVVKDLRSVFPSYLKLERTRFPVSAFKDDLLMPVAGEIQPEPQPEAKFQLSFIEGGALLSVCLYHHLTDGNGMNTITKALGTLVKQASESSGELSRPHLDTSRDIISNLNGSMTDLEHHPAYNIARDVFVPGAHHDEEGHSDEATPPPQFSPLFYHLSHEKAAALKKHASRDTPVSTHDAISAQIWRNLTSSRVQTGEISDLSTPSYFTIPHDARKHIGLAKTWIGNCTYFIVASAPVADVIRTDSIPVLAAKIRAALNAVDREHVEGVYTLRQQDNNVYSLSWWPIFRVNEPEYVGFSSFYHSDLMGDDWGRELGEVKHFTSTSVGAYGSSFRRAHFVGPKLPGGSGCDVHVGLTEKEVEFYQKDDMWNEYFSLRGASEVNGH